MGVLKCYLIWLLWMCLCHCLTFVARGNNLQEQQNITNKSLLKKIHAF